MQLTLAIFDLSDTPQKSAAPSPTPTPWDQLNDTSRVAALEILARLIARMLAAELTKGARDD